jgi:Ricin-type beta-trefoil lectin domain/Putative Ig domain
VNLRVFLITAVASCLAVGLALAWPAGRQPLQDATLALTARQVATSPGATTALPAAPAPRALEVHPASGSAPAEGTGQGSDSLPAARRPAKESAGTATCTEPGCSVSFQGGSVQHSPAVYLLLWGPQWTASSGTAPTAYNRLYAFLHGLGQSSDTWSTVTSQYADGSGSPAFGHPVLAAADIYTYKSTPPNPLTPADLAAEVQAFAALAGITNLADSQVMVAVQPGTCYTAATGANGATIPVFAGNCGKAASTGSCGWHSDATVNGGSLAYSVLPYELDAGKACGENWINSGTTGEYDGFTTVAGAEFADTVTDPFGTGWYDPSDTVTAGETGDKCAWAGKGLGYSAPKGNISLPVTVGKATDDFPFAVQSLWSNASSRCVLTSSPKVSLTAIGTQQSTMGNGTSLAVHATTNTSTAISYSASGLPHGLSISASTGKISGRVSVETPGGFHVTVTAANYAVSRSTSFAWLINSRNGVVKDAAGKCLDSSGNKTTTGTVIVTEPCGSTSTEKLTLRYNGALELASKCVTVNTRVFLYACKGLHAQTWTWQPSSGEYVLSAGGECLDASSTANGAKLAMAACRATKAEHWTLP